MSAPSKELLIGDLSERDEPSERDEGALAQVAEASDAELVDSALRTLSGLSPDQFAAVYVALEQMKDDRRLGKLLQSERILEGMPDGVVLLDTDNTVLWANSAFRQWCGRDNLAGANFYAALGSPEILGPDFCPFHTALSTGGASHSTLRSSANRYFHLHVAPLRELSGPPRNLILTVRDVTRDQLQQQKLAAIHQAGVELADLSPEELAHMTVEERIGLLKSNILHFTKDLLHYDVVEVRLLDANTGRLEPLLAAGMSPEAEGRVLFALPQNNGVTGFVAATGKSYLCEDTTEDPLYLTGAMGAKSSLTVPLMLHDEVIGTFNVESPEPRAFAESDLQFLEIFTRDVAIALNTLELLVAEKASTAAESVEAIHSAVALPVDDILNDAVNIMERYIGHEPDVVQRLERILRGARDIKQVIQKVGQRMAPAQASPHAPQQAERPLLRGRTILVADADETVRSAAHALLERYGCVVETAHDGGEAIFMVKNLLRENMGRENTGRGNSRAPRYDVIISDIRLPDLSGYELLLKLREIVQPLPLVLMTGFGYDPGHSIVKARQAGLQAVLYKPFRLDQLLDTIETTIQQHQEGAPNPHRPPGGATPPA